MPNEYSTDDKIILRSTDGTQMSLPAFFKLALRDDSGNFARPTSWRGHNAWDMGVAGATTVPAITPVFGTVSGCAQTGNNGGMGTYVIIEDEKGRSHRFMHMIENSLVVSSGDSVSQGDKLGIIGNTGDSQGAHLHYDVTVNGERINDPIDAFDCSTLPSGWNFGDAVDHDGDWDYIPLDNPPDYGPPGGDTPSEPFFTDKRVYDLSTYQSGSESEQLASDSTTGGFIIRWGQANSTTDYFQDNQFTTHLANARAKNMPVGFYFYWEINPDGLSDADITQLFESVFQYLTDSDVKPDNTDLGIWLDFEGGHSATPANNDHVIELFHQTGTALGFPVVGFYTYKSYLSNFTIDSVKDYPFWYSRPGEPRSTVDSELADYGFTAAYLWQDGTPGHGWSSDVTYYHQDFDNDSVLQPLPTVGSGGGGGGGGGGEVIKVTVDIVPPKRIYFNPTPGLLDAATDLLSDRKATITITTDADNAELYYTVDGSSPYQYTYVEDNLAYIVASKAQLYSSSITIHKDSHIRVVAVPSGTGIGGSFTEPLAKGSATYLFKYQGLEQSWEDEQKSYAISEGDVSFFEENKQAFLRLHAEQTEEEILYATVYKHDTQVVVEDAKDSASSFTGTKPDDERENADSDSDSDSDTPVNPKPDTEESEGD